ncbi:MAG: hypothetical protein ACK559_13555, partial [bacterium]
MRQLLDFHRFRQDRTFMLVHATKRRKTCSPTVGDGMKVREKRTDRSIARVARDTQADSTRKYR